MISRPAARVAIYTRVSTDNQLGDEGSLDTQEARLRAAVVARGAGHVVFRVFREEGASGKNLDRPAMREMIAAVTARQVDLVMVTRLDRLSRSLLDFYELHRTFEANGVQFVSLNETFDTSSPVGRAMLKLVLVFAELEREQTADRTRVAMQARAERGLWNGGAPPLGYDSDGSGHLSVNVHEASIVREAFAKVIELRSGRKVTRWLNESGYRQKRYASRRRGDKGERLLSLAVVDHMLANRLYLGEVPHQGKWHPGQHAAIVDVVSFDRAQNIRDDNRRGAKTGRKEVPHEYLLTGLARCATCDRALTSATSTNSLGVRYHYYRCVATSKHVDNDCPIGQLPAGILEEAVLEVVRRAAADPELIARAIREANRIAADQMEPSRARLRTLQAEQATNGTERHRLLDALLALGASGLTTARDRMVALETRARALEAAIAEEQARLVVDEGRSLSLEAIHSALRDFDQLYPHFTPGERRELLQELIDAVRVYPDRIEVALYDGTHATAPLAQAKRKVRGSTGGSKVHAVHAEAEARESAEGPKRRVKSPVKFAERLEWLPLLDSN